MKGFRDFLMRGNLIELAIAVVIGGVFAKVITAVVTIIMDIVGKFGGVPNFSGWMPGGVHVGDFLTAIFTFVVVAAVVYFLVMKPYVAAREKFFAEDDEDGPSEVELLKEIRDELRKR